MSSKLLVELSFTELPDHVNACHFRGFGEDRSIITTNLRNVVLSESLVIDKLDKDQLEFYLQEGFKLDRGCPETNRLILRKAEHFCFTNETKKVLDKLYSDEIDKWKKTIKASEELKDLTYEKLVKLNSKFVDTKNTIDNASFLKRLKYLFTGKLL